MKKLIATEEQPKKGFFFTVTDEQIREHQERSLYDIFCWLESANSFIFAVQTPQERGYHELAKNLVHVTR